MYTQCPECQTAFRLSADVLRKARGQVRCGGCGHTFDALDHLSEAEPGNADTSDTQSVNIFSEQSRALLDTLDELAGDDDIRIEDTGVEWRVLDLDDDDATDDDGATPQLDDTARWSLDEPSQDDLSAHTAANTAHDDLATSVADDDDAADDDKPGSTGDEVLAEDDEAAPDEATAAAPLDDEDDEDEADPQGSLELDEGEDVAGAMRFDDHTPLPDEFFRPVPEVPPESPLAESTADNAGDETDGLQVDLELGEDGEWEDLLDEVEPPAGEDDAPDDVAGDETTADPDRETAAAPEDEALASAADDEAPDETTPDTDAAVTAAGEQDDEAADDRDTGDDPHDATIAQDDGDSRSLLKRARAEDEPAPAIAADVDDEEDDDTLVESIVMEGDTVTDLLLKAEAASLDDVPGPDFDDEPAARGNGRRVAGFLGIVGLALLLGAQLVHANREQLATNDLIGRTLEPIYAALGQPLTPAWDIRGWQFEATDDTVDTERARLTIYSRIANQSSMSLPYPLVHVSLTDRYDEVIGSRMLEPSDYLAGTANENKLVMPGDGFTAVFTVDNLSPAAEGFKLNVCYRQADAQVRCAIEDFRN